MRKKTWTFDENEVIAAAKQLGMSRLMIERA